MTPAFAQTPVDTGAQPFNVPENLTDLLAKKGLDKKYQIIFDINPFYLRGDFNGDRVPDIAVLVKEKNSGKKGIAICDFARHQVVILGAGKEFDNGGGDDFEWMDYWYVYGKGIVERGVEEGRPPKLIAEALYVGKSESASALIYWTGRRYRWYQQGD
jgi:hypothetical protein